MRIHLIYILIFCHGFANAQSLLDREIGKFHFSGTLVDCIDSIMLRTDVDFNYKLEHVIDKTVKISWANADLAKALAYFQNQYDLRYEVNKNSISIIAKKNQKIIISGTVLDITSSERIPFVRISFNDDIHDFTTDPNGLFQLSTQNSAIELRIQHQNYQTKYIELNVINGQHLIIKLVPIVKLDSIHVKSHIDSIGLVWKDYDQLNLKLNYPTLIGELDLLTTVKLLPGIQNSSFGQQGLSVRGGDPDQNSILVDKIPVYNTFHLMGLYSIFNTPNIQNINIYKEAFPSQFANRLSTVIDIGLHNGNKKSTEVFVDLGLLSNGLAINGPILKNKLSYSLSLRRTNADLFYRPIEFFKNRSNPYKSSSYLWSLDIFGKLHYQLNVDNELSITSYFGGDQLNFNSNLTTSVPEFTEEKTNGSIGWRNKLVGLKWQTRFNSRLHFNLYASFSNYELKLIDEYNLEKQDINTINSSNYRSGIQEFRTLGNTRIFLNSNNLMKVGLGSVNYGFLPYSRNYVSKTTDNINTINTTEIDTNFSTNSFVTTEYYGYVDHKMYTRFGYVNFGIRATQYINQKKSFWYIQPKLYSSINLNKKSQLRLGYSKSNQFIQLIPNNSLGLPIDIWLPINNALQPLHVTQWSGRFSIKNRNGNISFGVFDKAYRNIVEYDLNTPNILNQNWENSMVSGNGISRGLESGFDFKFNNSTINFAYAYSRSMRTVDEINNGETYYTKFDRPHDFSFWASHSFKNKHELSIAFNYISGNLITLPTGRFITYLNNQKVILEDFDDINNFRLPAIHHLDVSYRISKNHKKMKSNLIIGVYNVYNRLNPFMAFIGIDESSQPVLKIRSLMPILPIIKYAIEFD